MYYVYINQINIYKYILKYFGIAYTLLVNAVYMYPLYILIFILIYMSLTGLDLGFYHGGI
jgi:hypothetical protein